MSKLSPETLLQPVTPLAAEVIAISKNAYETLESLRAGWDSGAMTREEHEQPDVQALAEALGNYAAAHLDDGLDVIPNLPLTEEVQLAAEAMKNRIVANKLKWAIFDQYEKREAARITEMLAGKTLVATSFNHGHGFSDGFGLSSGSNEQRENLTVIGKFLDIDVSQGSLWVGEAGNAYYVNLWRIDFDLESKKMTEVRQQSTLEVIDDPEFISPVRIGKMAVMATSLSGKLPEDAISRGIAVEAVTLGRSKRHLL